MEDGPPPLTSITPALSRLESEFPGTGPQPAELSKSYTDRTVATTFHENYSIIQTLRKPYDLPDDFHKNNCNSPEPTQEDNQPPPNINEKVRTSYGNMENSTVATGLEKVTLARDKVGKNQMVHKDPEKMRFSYCPALLPASFLTPVAIASLHTYLGEGHHRGLISKAMCKQPIYISLLRSHCLGKTCLLYAFPHGLSYPQLKIRNLLRITTPQMEGESNISEKRHPARPEGPTSPSPEPTGQLHPAAELDEEKGRLTHMEGISAELCCH
ncbi:hypothetical protein MJG53_009847 [Ovis ammon polii x Ovis aries]|uniref:Uncharacterized protein n=1 Tax=Ovis ammon polii x Ovis aries TaxID=2918886 RepID=A0ACB9UUR3_9CETA|nr:hypothetical protein MJG53_009847 [Ovis ammon polii x Ovis aries]